MIFKRTFSYKPDESEREKAANSYLISMVAVIAGMPLPIINFLATLFFWLGVRNSQFFVRWHSTQALFVQAVLFLLNVAMMWWLLSIVLGNATFTNGFIAYAITVVLINLTGFVMTIYSAIQVNKGAHVEWWLMAAITHQVCKK
jgi:hypothetical protein